MPRKKKIEALYDKHYHDMLDLNKRFIDAMRRPRFQQPDIQNLVPQTRKVLTKKQLSALARGRKKLADKRAKILQI